MLVDFDARGQQMEEALLWIMDCYFSQKQWFKVKTPQ